MVSWTLANQPQQPTRPKRRAAERPIRCADPAGAMTEVGMSRMSSIGILILAVSIAPFAVLCITDALGWTGPSTGCGFVALAVIGGGVGAVVWMVGLLSSPRQPRGTESLRD